MSYLMHHGIKGQKWGVRRYQNKDGSYTSEGKRRRGSRERPLFSKQEIEFANNVKNNTLSFIKQHKKQIAIGLSAAATGLALHKAYDIYHREGTRSSQWLSYGVNAPLSELTDRYSPNSPKIKAGSKLQRVSKDAIEDFKDKGFTYLSNRFRDNQYYKSSFRKEANFSSDVDFVHVIKPKHDLKIASPRTCAETMLSINPKIKDNTFRIVMHPYYTGVYDDDDDPFTQRINQYRDRLVTALKQQGYSGFTDIQDETRRKVAHPIVVFDPDEHLSVDKSRRIGKLEAFVAEKLQ